MGLNIHQEWFQIYSSAMLEMDGAKIIERIQRAEQAIRARINELQAIASENSAIEREKKDIAYALTHLKRLQRYGFAV